MRQKKTTLSKSEARRTIRNAADNPGLIELSEHGEGGMKDHDVTFKEMVSILRSGAITGEPAFNSTHHNWECEVQGVVSLTGKRVRVIAAIEIGEEGILIVTIFDVKGTRLR